MKKNFIFMLKFPKLKLGCINNTKQKALLKAAGHVVEARDLLTEKWTAIALRSFFGDLPFAAWFNPTAPDVKSGAIAPHLIQAVEALDLMIQNPLLIRRPLMQVGDRKEVGFDLKTVADWIGLQPINKEQKPVLDALIKQDLETCPNSKQNDHKTCKVTTNC
jgi:nitrogenase-associated protein